MAKRAAYEIDGELFCGPCAEHVGGSFITRKRFVTDLKCAGCDTRSVYQRLADALYPEGKEPDETIRTA